ncbi:MAG TPA: hypothetical protein VHK01_19950 [Lacipirellulaceae bacterium]|nr:hypothetical protein [Lacipirellulaceae bacterium]
MENRPSHEALRSELRRRGLPRAYIERLVAEIDDHFIDLLEERSTSMGASRKLQVEQEDLQQRLGEPAQLALFAAEQYHARNFWGRHPLVTYLLGPLPLLVGCFVAYGLAFWAVTSVVSFIGTYILGWTETTFANPADFIWLQAVLLALLCWYTTVFPPLTTAWLLCRTYRRNGLDWRWPVVGCTLVAIVCGMFRTSYNIATEPNTGQFMVGFDIGQSSAWLLRFLPKFAISLAIGLLLIHRARQQLALEAETRAS